MKNAAKRATLALLAMVVAQTIHAQTLTLDEARQKFSRKSTAIYRDDPLFRMFAPARQEKQLRIDQGGEELFRRWTNRIGALPPGTIIPEAKLVRIALGENPDAVSYTHFKLRASWEQLAESFEESKPAAFSYARDLRDDEDIWSAHGAAALIYERTNWPANPGRYPLNRLTFSPGIEFDRVSGGPRDKQTDSLVFKTGGSADFVSNDPHRWRGHVFSVAPVYATDFHFRSSQFGGEFNFKPILDLTGFNSHNQDWITNGPIATQFTLTLHAEGGHVFDAGQKSDLHEGDGYGRVGPLAGFQIKLNRQKELRGYVSWDQRESFVSDSKSTRLFTGGVSLALINESLLLTVEYRDGRIPLTAEKVRTIAVTLGVKL